MFASPTIQLLKPDSKPSKKLVVAAEAVSTALKSDVAIRARIRRRLRRFTIVQFGSNTRRTPNLSLREQGPPQIRRLLSARNKASFGILIGDE